MGAALRRLAIVGGGEIAMRIVRAAREHGAARGDPIELIALHEAADRGTLVVRDADEAIEIDGGDLDAVTAALVACGADTAWIGFDGAGAPTLADRCAGLGIATVGPSADALRRAGATNALQPLAVEAGATATDLDGGAARRIDAHVVADGHGSAWVVGLVDASVRDAVGTVLAESAGGTLTAEQRRVARAVALRLTLACGHAGAGTVALRLGLAGSGLSLIGFEPTLTSEHALSELTTGLDLATLQLQIAAGALLGSDPPDARGHAIQAALRVELPAAGLRAGLLRLPAGPFVRVDTSVAEGDILPAEQSLIGAITAWGPDRTQALARLRRALAETLVVIEGGTTNQGLLLELTARPELLRGSPGTTWLEELRETTAATPGPGADVALLQAAIEVAGEQADVERRRFAAFARRGRPYAEAPLSRTVELRHHEQDYRLTVAQIAPRRYRIGVDGAQIDVVAERRGEHERRLTIGRRTARTLTSTLDADLLVEVEGTPHRVARDDGGIVRNPAPAVVVALPFAVGDEVHAGDVVAVVESMKMESSLIAPFAGRVRALLATPNVQVGAQAPLVQLEPLGHRSGRSDGADRVVFTSAPPAGTGPLDAAMWLLLGFDVSQAEAEHAIRAARTTDSGVEAIGEAERRVLECYADVRMLTRPRHEDTDEETLLRSPQEHFHAWLRTLDPEAEGLPPRFATALQRALRHYGVESLDRTPALEDAAYRLFIAEQRGVAARGVALALLDRCLDASPAPAPAGASHLRETLDRVVQVAERRDPEVADVARECRWRLFDEPLVAAAREAVLDEALLCLDGLAAGGGEAHRREDVAMVVRCPFPLVTAVAERLSWPGHRQRVLLEVMTRRFYRMPSLRGFGDADGMLTATYTFAGRERHLATAFIALEDLEQATARFAGFAAGLPAGAEASADLYARWDGPAPDSDALARDLRARLSVAALPASVHRIVVAVAVPVRGRGLGAVETFTFRPGPDGLYEDEFLRGMHPMIAHRLQVWRLSNFKLDRLPSAEDVYVFHGVARENPKDERLFAIAEVRDLTAVRDEDGRLTALPEFERMYVEALEGLRGFQAHRAAGRRLQWNRVLLYVWPQIDLTPAEMTGLLARLAPATEGLGIEMVLVRGRLREGDGVVRDRVLRFFSPAGAGVLVEVDDPPTRALEPLDEGARRIVSARRRGTPHPAEVLKLLGGAFEEHDLDDAGQLVPVSRPVATNSASVVVGLVRNVTARHPEGMLRVALLGDPTRALGSLAEPECRRIIAALDLAERLGVPLEWFALSAGAKIAMDSGTENMDWIADVLRRIIEFTQARRRAERRRDGHQRRRPAVLERRGDDADAHARHPRDDARQRDGADGQAGARLLRRGLRRGQPRASAASSGSWAPTGRRSTGRPTSTAPAGCSCATTTTPTSRPASASRAARRPPTRANGTCGRSPHHGAGLRSADRRRHLQRRHEPRAQEAVRHPLA